MLDLRLYRATLLPFALGLIIVAFSLHAAPPALQSSQPAPSIGSPAVAVTRLAADGRDPAPGSAADDRLAERIAYAPVTATPPGLADADFQVRLVRERVTTAAGTQTVDSVIASRAGTGPGIAVIAERGGPGPSGGLDATAVLVQIADALRNVVTVDGRPITLVSTAGGAGGIAALAPALPAGLEAAIVIGGAAGPLAPGAAVVPWSTAGGQAPAQLRLTVESALAAALGGRVRDVSLVAQLTRLALPLTTGEQGPLGASGVPALLASSAAESATATGAASSTRLAAFGQGILDALTTLDGGPALAAAPTRDLTVGRETLDSWGVGLIVGLLVLSAALCTLDVMARSRRRRARIGASAGWVLSCAAPFVLAGLFVIFLGAGGLLPSAPSTPSSPRIVPIGAAGAAALVSVALLFVLAWVLRAAVLRLRRPGPTSRRAAAVVQRPRRAVDPTGASAALLAIATAVAFVIWLVNPYTALLVVVPLHVWLVALTREAPRTPLRGAVTVAASLLLPLAALAVVCAGLSLSPLGLVWMLVLLVATGGLSLGAMLAAALAAGCAVAAGVLLLAPVAPLPEIEVTVRGPLSYAGPGSLGGTESALRR